MKAPQRFLERGRNDLVARLVRSAQGDAPSRNSWRRALAAAGAAARVTATGGAAASVSAASEAALFVRWLALGALVGTVTAFGITHFRATRHAPARHASVAPPALSAPPAVASQAPAAQFRRAPSRRGGITPPTSAVRGVAGLPGQHSSAAPAEAAFAPSPNAAPEPDTLSAELRQIDAARRALERRDAAGALRCIARYERNFPKPHLGQEASVLRIEALELAGRRAAAERRAHKFLVAHPHSALSARVRTLLGRP